MNNAAAAWKTAEAWCAMSPRGEVDMRRGAGAPPAKPKAMVMHAMMCAMCAHAQRSPSLLRLLLLHLIHLPSASSLPYLL